MERHLGLHRVFRTPSPRSMADVSEARRQPLKALRQAARTITPMTEQARSNGQTRMPEATLIRWNQSRGAAGRGTAHSGSSPWRG